MFGSSEDIYFGGKNGLAAGDLLHLLPIRSVLVPMKYSSALQSLFNMWQLLSPRELTYIDEVARRYRIHWPLEQPET